MADTNAPNEEVARLMALPLEDHYATLASLTRQPFGPQESLAQQIDRGRALGDQIAASLKTRVCVDWDCCARLRASSLVDNVDLAAALADAIAGAFGQIPPAVIAVMLVKRGLKQLCNCSS